MNNGITKIIIGVAMVILLITAKYVFSTTKGFENWNEQFASYCLPFILVYVFYVTGFFKHIFSEKTNKE
jgi:hypothetical protein